MDKPFENKIKKSTSVEESLKIRKQLSRFRRFWSLLILIIFTVAVIALSISVGSEDTIGRDIGMIIAFAIIEGWSRLKGNVQANSKEEYLEKTKKKGFVLYLRAFESDFYTNNPKAGSFEAVLAKSIEKQGKNVCAIGMTKELDAPYGATRVYVSDESWQEDVRDLMHHAESIFILLSDRESCIWEIAQSTQMLQKTCFIIDNEERYNNVRKELTAIPFPEYDEIQRKAGDYTQNNSTPKSKEDEIIDEMLNEDIKTGLLFHGNEYSVYKTDDIKAFTKKVLEVTQHKK